MGGAGGAGDGSGTWNTTLVVLAWFVLNIAMGNSTKWIFVYGQICFEGKGCSPYKFPLTITVIHMAFSWLMCRVQIYHVRGATADLSIAQQLRKIAPLAVCFALSVAMGNLSLKYIYPSFNQMLGSMSPLITVALAVVMQRSQYNAWTWATMPVICGGLAVCSAKEVNFHPLGVAYAIGATVLRAMKSVIQGRILSDSKKKIDSVTLLYYMAPWAAALLLVLALSLEGLQPVLILLSGLDVDPGAAPATGAGYVFILLLVSGLNACLLNVANFLVTSYTSPLTLQVLGNVKNCLSIAVSLAIFRNTLKPEQVLGVITCLFGVWLYNKKGGLASRKKAASEELELQRGTDRPQTELLSLASPAKARQEATTPWSQDRP